MEYSAAYLSLPSESCFWLHMLALWGRGRRRSIEEGRVSEVKAIYVFAILGVLGLIGYGLFVAEQQNPPMPLRILLIAPLFWGYSHSYMKWRTGEDETGLAGWSTICFLIGCGTCFALFLGWLGHTIDCDILKTNCTGPHW